MTIQLELGHVILRTLHVIAYFLLEQREYDKSWKVRLGVQLQA